MRIIQSVTAIAAAGLLLAGCGGQTSSSAAGGADATPTAVTSDAGAAESPTPEWDGPVIPDGTYAQVRTAADAKRLGIPRNRAAELLGDDDEFHGELKIAGDAWAQFGDDGGSMSIGDEGTATYDADGHWVITSASTGCPGCVSTYDWSLEDDRLRLTMLDTTEAGDPVNVLVARLVTEGTWVRR